eukprot:TRINITY_DN10804_c0_g1_i1.p1 TRINITY_DN10804_c0_g1~~TRINITY_DN10804_c0_g1_i1.p1  ORF type:complete len:335 (-),score=82.83 TRINITY_DN10804_c0_g1_i1:94-1098(-)
MFGKKKSKGVSRQIDTLEDCITDRNAMLRFIVHLDKQYALDNFTFWLETQVYKYIRNQDQMDTMAQSIYDRYFGPKGQGINIDDEILRNEIEEKIKGPTRTTFMLIQNAIWGLLKLDCFPKFKDSGEITEKLKSKLVKQIQNDHGETVKLLDQFLELNKEHPIDGGFKPNVLPDDFYEEHLHTVLPDINEVWKDRDLFLAFREYLYQQFANENLAFYLEAAHFELVPKDQRTKRAKEIFNKFIGPDAPVLINLDGNAVNTLNKACNLAEPAENTFLRIKEKIYKVLENEWFPDFIVSPLYHACNDETITYVKSDGGRKRSDTIVYYELLFSADK